MRIKVQLPKVDAEVCEVPEECPYEGCEGRNYKPHGIKGEEKGECARGGGESEKETTGERETRGQACSLGCGWDIREGEGRESGDQSRGR